MVKSIAQWIGFVLASVGFMSASLAWVFHKDEPPVARVRAPEPPPVAAATVARPEPIAVTVPPPLDLDPVEETLEGDLRRCLLQVPGIDKPELGRLAQRGLVDVLTCLTEWIEPTHDLRLIDRSLFAFNLLSRMGFPIKSPHRLIELARFGDVVALESAARIGDARAERLFVELLRSDDRSKEGRSLLGRAAFFARHLRSPLVGAELNRLALAGSVTALESLAHVARGIDRAGLQRLSRGRNGTLKIWAARALEANAILASPNVQDRLMDVLSRPPAGALYSWPDWALEELVALKLTTAAEPLRRHYEKLSASPHGLPEGAGLAPIQLKLLATIHRLGGRLTASEREALDANPLAE